MERTIDKAPVDTYDESGKLLLAKGRKITSTAYKRVKKYIQRAETTSEDEAQSFDISQYWSEICRQQDFSTALSAVDLMRLTDRLPKGKPEDIREAAHCLAESMAKVKQRPYRPGCSPEEALNIIVNDGGYNKFSPTIIKACGEIIRD